MLVVGVTLLAMGSGVILADPPANEGSYFNRVRLRTDELPLKPERVVQFTTSEGTRMSLDVSPDGRSIVFDLLGDLYVLPIEGGTTQRIASGMSSDHQPRFSPDGRTIAFASDRTGEVEIWLIDADGRNPRPLRSEGAFGSRPAWRPDGRAISLNPVYRLPTPVRNEEREHGPKIYPLDVGEPEQTAAGGCCDAVFAPDGRYLYSSVLEDRDARRIVRVNLQTNAVQTLTSDSQFAFSPLPSRDGQWLVYGQVSGGRVDESSIALRELSTGQERTLIEQALGYDAYHANVLPGMAFTPDSRALIVSLEGKIWRVDVPSGERTLIPFVAEVEQHLGPRVHFDAKLEGESIIARHLTNIRMSPDAAKLAFEAALQIYIADRSNDGSVVNYRRLTNLEEVEREPVFSADNRWVVFTTYDDLRQGGYVYKAPVDVTVPPTRLTDVAGVYLSPVMTSDGRGVLVLRGAPAARLGYIWPGRDRKPEIVLKYDLVYLPMTARSGSRERVIARDIEKGDISITADGKRAFVLRCVGYVPGATKWPCVAPSTEIDLEQGKVVSTPQLADIEPSDWPDFVTRAQISPDGEQVVASTRQHVYLTQLLSSSDTKVMAKRIDLEGGDAPAWRADGRIVYSYRNRLYAFDPATGKTERTDLELRLKTDRPSGAVAFTNARLITMRSDEIIERGDILILDNRIAAIGRHGTIAIPRKAHVIDASGKTIIPGYLDLHNHLETGYGTDGMRQRYGTTAALAYGTTTLQYPGNVHDQWEYDATAVGAMLAPRVLSMGRDFDEIGRLDADSIAASVCRYADNFGGVATYKEYHGGNRLRNLRDRSISPLR